MANFLKINKKSIGEELIVNPEFSMTGPEILLNNDFSDYYGSEYLEVEGVNFSDWKTDRDLNLTIDGSYKLEPIDGGYKQTVVTPVSSSSNAYQHRISQIVSDKVDFESYILSFKIRVSEDSLVRVQVSSLNSPSTQSNQQYFPITYDVKADSDFIEIDIPFRYQGYTGSDVYLQFWKEGVVSSGSTIEVKEVYLKQTGVNYLSTFVTFSGQPNDKDVSLLPSFSDFNNPVSAKIVGGSMVVETSGQNQGVRYRKSAIGRGGAGTEINIKIYKIESITGLPPGGATMYIDGVGDIDCSAGSLDFTFTYDMSFPANLDIYFKAGNNSAGTTRYTNIEITRTKKIPFNFFYPLADEDLDYSFTDSSIDVRGGGNPSMSTTPVGENSAIFSYDVLESNNILNPNYIFFGGKMSTLNTLVGSYSSVVPTSQGSTSMIWAFSVNNGNLKIGNLSLKEIKNQPKLIGVDSVSRVSAPTNNTVVITNGLTDGADTVTITYDESEVSSTVEMRNYFQDKIIEAANSNNTDKVIEINPPATIIDIIAS